MWWLDVCKLYWALLVFACNPNQKRFLGGDPYRIRIHFVPLLDQRFLKLMYVCWFFISSFLFSFHFFPIRFVSFRFIRWRFCNVQTTLNRFTPYHSTYPHYLDILKFKVFNILGALCVLIFWPAWFLAFLLSCFLGWWMCLFWDATRSNALQPL